MKDVNEFNAKNIAEKIEKNSKRRELNEVVLDLSLGIKQNTADKLKNLLKGVDAIRTVKIRGMIEDASYNMDYIMRTLSEMHITVRDIDLEVEI